jgi:hypothetical protein
MRYSIPISILACSVGFAMGSGSSPARPNAADDAVLKGEETAVPLRKKAPVPKKKEKVPTPLEKQAAPEEEDPPESPAQREEADEAADCDDCVIVRNTQEAVTPSVAKTAGVTASGPVSATEPVQAGSESQAGNPAGQSGGASGWPLAMAKTLWGLFFVGRPRAVPKTRIRGVTVK